MRRPPRDKDAPVITRRMLGRILFSAAIIVGGSLSVYVTQLADGLVDRRDQSMVRCDPARALTEQTFSAFVILDLVSALQNRGLGCGLTANSMLCATVGVSFLVQLSLLYVGPLQRVFQTEALSTHDLGLVLGLGLASFVLHELRRRYERATLDDERFAASAV